MYNELWVTMNKVSILSHDRFCTGDSSYKRLLFKGWDHKDGRLLEEESSKNNNTKAHEKEVYKKPQQSLFRDAIVARPLCFLVGCVYQTYQKISLDYNIITTFSGNLLLSNLPMIDYFLSIL